MAPRHLPESSQQNDRVHQITTQTIGRPTCALTTAISIQEEFDAATATCKRFSRLFRKMAQPRVRFSGHAIAKVQDSGADFSSGMMALLTPLIATMVLVAEGMEVRRDVATHAAVAEEAEEVDCLVASHLETQCSPSAMARWFYGLLPVL